MPRECVSQWGALFSPRQHLPLCLHVLLGVLCWRKSCDSVGGALPSKLVLTPVPQRCARGRWATGSNIHDSVGGALLSEWLLTPFLQGGLGMLRCWNHCHLGELERSCTSETIQGPTHGCFGQRRSISSCILTNLPCRLLCSASLNSPCTFHRIQDPSSLPVLHW